MATIGAPPISAPALARTYSHPSYADPWECVQDYQRVLEYTGARPDAGSTAVASAIDLPRSRIRPWMAGSRPDCVRAIQVAESREWLSNDMESPVFRGLNVFLAWILSGGCLNSDWYVPYFVVNDDDDVDLLYRATEVVDVDLDTTRSASSQRSMELRPLEHASVLGRVLYLLGGPVGEKNADSDVSLPSFLPSAPEIVRQEFAAIYVSNRGTVLEDRNGAVRIREERSRGYLRSLARFFREVTGGETSLHEKSVYLHPATARSILEWPAPLSDLS